MAGYTRQSTAEIAAGQDVDAAPLADEFNAIQSAFSGVSGHSHDGSTGNGPKIDLTTSVSGRLPVANMAQIASMKVWGNATGSLANVAEVSILDEDNMASNSATALATQQSIKAYVDNSISGAGLGDVTTNTAQTISALKTFNMGTNYLTTTSYMEFRPLDYGTANKLRLHIGTDSGQGWQITAVDSSGTIGSSATYLRGLWYYFNGASTGEILSSANTVSGIINKTFSSCDADTAAAGTSNTKLATTAFVQQERDFIHISTQTLGGTAAQVVFTNIPTTYSKLILVMRDVVTNAAATTDTVTFQVSTDNGSTFKTTSGDYYHTTTALTGFIGAGAVIVCGNTSTFKNQSAEVHFIGMGDSTFATSAHSRGAYAGVSTTSISQTTPSNLGMRTVAETDNAFRIVPVTGTLFAAGSVFSLFGMVE